MANRGDVYERYYMPAFIDRDCCEETRWYELHSKTQAEINTLKRQLSKDWLEKTIKEFYKTVHTIEVDQQLQGIRPADILTPPSIEYELEERATVANCPSSRLMAWLRIRSLKCGSSSLRTSCGSARGKKPLTATRRRSQEGVQRLVT
ncbi:hypothetical protein B0J14DRAFT_567735 [Halenospora varia]|nr:hypothetical protein B0J14DRAFT_567735 [Halenospora varia]